MAHIVLPLCDEVAGGFCPQMGFLKEDVWFKETLEWRLDCSLQEDIMLPRIVGPVDEPNGQSSVQSMYVLVHSPPPYQVSTIADQS